VAAPVRSVDEPHKSRLENTSKASDHRYMRLQSKQPIRTATLAALVGALVVIGAFLLVRLLTQNTTSSEPPRPIAAASGLDAEERATIRLFEDAQSSVVYITSLSVERDYLSMNVFEIPQGAGSGFIWNSEGYIVTNFHVIQNAQVARVTLSDQSTHEATLVGIEPDKDIAVIKIDGAPSALKPIPVGTSKDLRVGQRVFAIGNPFGFDHTLTTGVISGLDREIQSVTNRPIHGVIQTDAAINPGNSGGPLLDSSGRLIGMNTAIVSPSGAYAGIGFAVPVDTINRIVPQLIKRGRAKKPGLGIRVIESDLARRQGVVGAIIANVIPGSPADKAGLEGIHRTRSGGIELGDIITQINGEPVTDGNDLLRELDERAPGDTVKLTVNRRGSYRDLLVELGQLQ